ncbi:MAG: tetratricopeptide repeat protein [Desulfobacterales bacterium]|jgi:tetratricopeptide (TPR) repeat protein|nr:tetratricopeptide repeat protein [Desulfobacteraceae bacterium]MDD3991294.1 tetratricopeptide repeat protein [Desulfobacteraceae bacterium]MDY0311593.1 tetratricopeptide repeat protein [Desulfobacterales bacterium]
MKISWIAAALLCLTGCAMLGIHLVEDSLTAADHNDLGFSYEAQDRLELAEKQYQKAARKDKDWHTPCFNLGNVYYKMGQPEKAAAYYRLSLKRKPDHADSMNNLAFVRMQQKRYHQARRWIDRAIAIEAKPEYLDTRQKILQQGAKESKK